MGQTDRQTGRQLSRPLGPSAQLFQSPKSPPPMGPDTVTGERKGGEEAEEADGRRPARHSCAGALASTLGCTFQVSIVTLGRVHEQSTSVPFVS